MLSTTSTTLPLDDDDDDDDEEEVVIVPPNLPPFEPDHITTAGSRSSYKLVSKTGTTSKWWKHFKIYHSQYLRSDPDTKDKAVCVECGDEINVQKGISGLSGHMQHHHEELYMKSKHPELYRNTNTTGRMPIDKLLGAKKLPSQDARRAEVFDVITAWVIEENQPLNAVEKPSFRRMLKTIDESCPVPTIAHLRDDIMYLGKVMRYQLEVCLPIICNTSGSFTDPLLWWVSHAHQYPTLFELSLRYLSIPATSAPSERLWSVASRIVTIRRASLESKIIGDLMFVKENSILMNQHFYNLTGKERVLPKVYPALSTDDDEEEDK